MRALFPRDLLAPDRVALGLTRAQLSGVVAAAVAAYTVWRGLGSGTVGAIPAGVLLAIGAGSALVRFEGQDFFAWAALIARWLTRRTPLLLEVQTC